MEMLGTQGFTTVEPVSAMTQPEFSIMPSQLGLRADHEGTRLKDAGCTETAELVARLADRLLRQERLLVEERARSADLELKLAVALTSLAPRADVITITA